MTDKDLAELAAADHHIEKIVFNLRNDLWHRLQGKDVDYILTRLADAHAREQEAREIILSRWKDHHYKVRPCQCRICTWLNATTTMPTDR